MKEYSKSRRTAANEARMAGIQTKRTAGRARVRELLSTLPPEVAAKLDQKELSTGVAIMPKEKLLDNRAVIQSPSAGMYSWNGSNVMTGPELLKRIAQLAMAQSV
jgi:hypothetical protein